MTVIGYVVIEHAAHFAPSTFGVIRDDRETAEQVASERNAKTIKHVTYTVAEVRELEHE